jgi:hypothetical protein
MEQHPFATLAAALLSCVSAGLACAQVANAGMQRRPQGSMRGFINQEGQPAGATMALSAATDSQGSLRTGSVAVSRGVVGPEITDTGLAAQITAGGTKFFRHDAPD